MGSTSTRRSAALAAILALGLGLRLKEAGAPRELRELWIGQWEYYGLGLGLSRGGGYRLLPGLPETAFRLPLYPSFIAAVARAAPGLSSLRRAQALLDAAAVAGVFGLGAAAGGPAAGLLGAAFYALDPAPSRWAAEVAIEPFLGFLVVVAGLAMVWWAGGLRDPWRAAAAGAAVGLSLFCRSTLAFFPPLAAVWFGLSERRFWRARALWVFLALAYLPLLPWAARNHRLFGEFIPLEGGAAAVNAWAASAGAVRAVNDFQLEGVGDQAGLYAATHNLGERERSRRLFAAAAGNLAAHPWRYLASCARRLPVLWSEQALWIVLAAGLLIAAPPRPEAAVLLLLAAYFNIHILMAVQPRYAQPASGLLCALSGCGAAAAASRLGLGRFLRPPAPARPAPALGRAVAAALVPLAGLYAFAVVRLAGEGAPPAPAAAQRAELQRLHDGSIAAALRGDWQGAEKGFDEVLRRDPAFGESLVSRGLVRERQGRPNAARQDYEAALRLVEGGSPR